MMTEPGWYTDPRDSSQYRYWDGSAWTEAVAPGAAAETFVDAGDGNVSVDQAAVDNEPWGGAATDSAATDSAATDTAVEAASEASAAFDDRLDDASEAVTRHLPEDPGRDSGGLSVDEALRGMDASTGNGVGPPSLDDPTVDVSGFDVSDLTATARELPDVDLPGVDRPAVDLPDVDLPGVERPAVDLPEVDLPEADLPAMPKADLPDVDLPNRFDSIDAPAPAGLVETEGFSQGVSVDEVLGDVTDPLDEAFEAASAQTSDLTDGGIPGDGVSFTSPIDGFGPADQTAVIPGPGPPFDAPAGPDGFTPGFGADQGPDGYPPQPPPGAGQGFSDRGQEPEPGFGRPGDFPDAPGGFPPSHEGYGSSDDRFGGPGPDFGGSGFGDPAAPAPRPVSPPTVVPSKSKTPWIVLGVIGLAVVAVLLFLAVRGPGTTAVDSISIGQCFADFDQFDATEIRSSVSSADCNEEHALEVFAVTDDPYRDFVEYPGEDVIKDLAFRHCLDGFEAFVGTAYGDSALDVWALYPTDGSWNLNGDREVVCMVGAFDKSLTVGTLAGSGR